MNPKTGQKVVVLGWICLPGPSTRGESQNDFEQLYSGPFVALPEVPIDELVECLGRCQIVSIAGEEPVCDAGGQAEASSARQAAGCALAKPMAAHGHVNGWREGTA